VLTRLQLHIPVSSNEVQDYPSGPVSLLQEIEAPYAQAAKGKISASPGA